jgi:colicin import membrane protein
VQFGLLISVLLHAAILGGALISIHSRPEPRVPEPEPVAVGMISPGEVTKVRQGVRTAKLLEAAAKESPKGDLAKKEAARPKMAAALPPPPPPPPAAPEEKKEPAPPKAAEAPAPPPAAEAQRKLEAEQQKLADKRRLAEEKRRAEEQEKAEAMKRAEEQRLAQERKRAEEEHKRLEQQRRQAELKKKREAEKRRREAALRKKRAEEKKRREEKARQEAEAAKKKQFDADKIAALLNKVPDKAAPPPPSPPPNEPTKARGPTLGAPEGRDRRISASEIAMIRQAIMSCVVPNWRVLSGGASAQETSVKIRIRFNADGTLSAPPVVTNHQETPYFRAISESALRAVQQCEPYNLPPDKYEFWKDVVMNFSPKDMF